MCQFGSDSDSDETNADVVELTDANFDKLVLENNYPWLVEFSAPWCTYCRSLKPHWIEAANELKGKVKFGIIDASAHPRKAKQYVVRGYPTIKAFPRGRKSSSDAIEYTGGRRASKIVAWALENFTDKVAAPEIMEIVDEKTFDSVCENKSLCVISVLPNILDCDAKCRNTYLDILKDMTEKYKTQLWGWVWTESAAQSKLEETLEIDGFGYPVMAVVNFEKMQYYVLKGSFAKENIDKFLKDIANGRGKRTSIRGAWKPKINKIQRWNGKDGKSPKIEES